MTGKTRMLGAGRAGSTAYGSNVNLIQFGDRLQGLAPQATHFFISGNGRAGWNQYQTRTYAPKRNFIFCMNQLGGVGAGKSQFKIGGLNHPDGAKYCAPYPYKNNTLQHEKNASLGTRTDYSSLSSKNLRSLWEGYCSYIVEDSLYTLSAYEETFYNNLAVIDELNEKETHGATFNLTNLSYYDEDTVTTKLSSKNRDIELNDDKKEMPEDEQEEGVVGKATTNIPIPSSVKPLSPITFQKSFLDKDEIQSYLTQINSTERIQSISISPTLISRIVKAIYGKSYNYQDLDSTKIRYTCETHGSHYDVIEGIKGRPQGNSVVLYLQGTGTFSISNEKNNKDFPIEPGTLISWDNYSNYHKADGMGCRTLIGPLILSNIEDTTIETDIQVHQGNSGRDAEGDEAISDSSYISTNNPFLATKNYQRNEFQCFSIQDLSNIPYNYQKANCKLVQFTSVLLALVAIRPISKGETFILSHKVSLERLSLGIYNYWGPPRGLQVYQNNSMNNNSLLYKTQNWAGLYAPPVINQGECGDCWAVSATEQMVADAVRLKYLNVPTLYSINQARSCTTLFNNEDHGCYGGLSEDVFQYASSKYNEGSIAPNSSIKVSQGTSLLEFGGGDEPEDEDLNQIVEENEVDQDNYTSNIICNNKNISNCLKVKNYYKISKDSSYQTEQAMKNHLMETGTLSICIVASSKKWQHYESGIIGFNEDTYGNVVDHAVLAVGFAEAKKRNFSDYYIIQNSWGDKWGNKGFIKLAFGYDAFKLTSNAYYTNTIIGEGTEPKSIYIDGTDEESVAQTR
jgi:hypothetical protein